tara:strand:- start:2324 stop:3976 length:1653 start_codon:yes stop_codon:yes gene_type:complete
MRPEINGLNALTSQLVNEYWDFYPTVASRIGEHSYDGRLPDLSATNTSRRIRRLKQRKHDLSTLSVNDPVYHSIEHKLLSHFLDKDLFNLQQMESVKFNPVRQVGHLNIRPYIMRNYAPLTDRLRSMSSLFLQVPEFLKSLTERLDNNIGHQVLQASIDGYSGIAHLYRTGLDSGVQDCKDQSLVKTVYAASELAAKAVDEFIAELKHLSSSCTPDSAIGSDLFSSMLLANECVSTELSDLIRIGQSNLEDNLAELKSLANTLAPRSSIKETVMAIAKNHPSDSAVIPETQKMLEDIRSRLIALDIVSLPSEDRCLVVETPEYMRYAFAAMDSPGSLERSATESFYYITPAEPDWSQREREEWLSNFNYDTLRIISIHEVYPGHFTHHLHNRYGSDLPLINLASTSYAFTEGWAHYAEQIMVEIDYPENTLQLKITQILEALVRNCRYMCSIGIHTQGMSVDEATQFFVENAYMEELPARKEAMRGTFDPGYLNYTLGKLMILKLRSDFYRENPDTSLKSFHDRLLSHGAPPIPILRDMLLKQSSHEPMI